MASSDDKQNRLSTLSQDVIAVPKKPAAPAPAARAAAPEKPPERPPEPRRDIPPAQDVFKVSTQAQPAIPPAQDVFRMPPAAAEPVVSPPSRPATPPPATRRPVVRVKSEGIPPALMGVGAVAGLALLVAIYAVASGGGKPAAAGGPEIAKLQADLVAANERVAKLEAKLSAASADAQKLGAPGQGNVLQLSAGIRELHDNIDMVSNDVAAVKAQIDEVRTLAGTGARDAKNALGQIDQVGARVATLNQQVANLPRGGGASPAAAASGDVQAQLKSLAQKTDKMAADIRQLYRQVGAQ